MITKKLILAAAFAGAATMGFAAPAMAQAAGGIATADPTVVVANSKALAAANDQIRTTFKDALAKIEANQTERQKVLAQLDKNGDKQVDDAELAAAEQQKNPALAQLNQLESDGNKLTAPVLRAQAFAVEMILQRYSDAQKSVVAAKKISVILSPDAFVYAPEGADVTGAITTALDTLVPSVPITAPQNWNPTDETLQVLQRVQRIQQYKLAIAAAQARQAGGAAPAPAGAAPAPAAAAAKPAAKPQSR
ncbi:OmpH family outer membrane protein [Sphingomonas sp.]|uniref:OmpH family outer membrane protein n=1 Tax=Sphingomonas sp. TaxID=28214 RepID=UPI001B2A8B4A|nr:OmpH family outer membrane protein [Sphingomonas sp.]MBO9711919.1 OmpH family outer membrane protein [Sphingomonas sp.]